MPGSSAFTASAADRASRTGVVGAGAFPGGGERVVLSPGVEASVLAHERGGASADAPAVGRAHVFVAIPGKTHGMRPLFDEDIVLSSRGAVSIELDHRHVPYELAPRCRSEQRRQALQRVRRTEGAVLGIRGEDIAPPVTLDELARVRQVPRAQLVDLDEISDPLRAPGHGTGSSSSSKEAVPVSGRYGWRQISTGNDTMMSEYRSWSRRSTLSGRS